MWNWLQKLVKPKDSGEKMMLPASGNSNVRSPVNFPIQSGKVEVKPWERMDVVQKSKFLDGSLGFFNGMIKRLARYMVPISPMPNTADHDWNALARKEWKEWSCNPKRCDIQGLQSYPKITQTMIRNFLRSGEVFQGSKPDPLGPKIQLIDPVLVRGVANTVTDFNPEGWMDGIKYDNDGIRVAYAVKGRDGIIKEVSVADLNHVFDVDRIDQPRGLPWFVSGLNQAIDIVDLVALEKAAAKFHASLSATVTKKSGTAEDGMTGTLHQKLLAEAAAEKAAGDTKDETQQSIEEIQGILVKYLNPDEAVTLLESKHPSSAFAGFMDFLVKDIAWSGAVTPEFVWDISKLNGNNMRFVMGDAQSLFDDVIGIIVDGSIRDTYLKVIGTAIVEGRLPPIADWYCVNFVGPPKLTIDNGKDTQNDLLRLRNGMMTYPEYYALRNKDAREERTIGIQWWKETIEECEAAGVPIAMFIGSIGGANNSPDPANPDASLEDNKDGATNPKEEKNTQD